MVRVDRVRVPVRRTESVAAAVAMALFYASAHAQTAPNSAASAAPPAEEPLEEVVVTGTAIRGTAPVGSNLVTIDRGQIDNTNAQTVQQILEMVPSVTGFGTPGQGGYGSADASGTDAPTIHGLGASASNSTLILVDGHRIPLSGINHALGDPNIIVPAAIDHVEVLADGASSIYGSDAVAGVINFITRRQTEGLDLAAQYGVGSDYHTDTASALWGHVWETGSVSASYGYSNRTALATGDRDYTQLDHISQGGTDLASFACSPATVSPAGQALIFPSPYTGAGIANVPANAPCDYSAVASLIPSEQRNNGFIRLEQDVTSQLHFSSDFVYSNREDWQAVQRGSVTATVYGPGSTGHIISPYFTDPTGSTASSETVRWDADTLQGPPAYIASGAQDIYLNTNLAFSFNDHYVLTFGGTVGTDISNEQQVGTLCTSCAYLALNGTTNGSGSLTAPSIAGTTVTITQPLTAANALDVWAPIVGNPTPASVLSTLTNSTTTFVAHSSIDDLTLKLDGDLFALPGGEVRTAVGAEYIHYGMNQDVARPLNIGPATIGDSSTNLYYERSVESEFAELLVPILGDDFRLPGVKSMTFDVSGRHDHYSDVGNTSNPKFALDWVVVEGLKVRANYARSFVAPALTSRGADGITSESGFGSYALGPVTVPYAAYPTAAQIPGCSPTATSCVLGTTVLGGQISGGNAALKPETGDTWTMGLDFTPIDSLKLSASWWHSSINGAITAPLPSFSVSAAGLNNRLTIYPAGATAAQIAAAQGSLILTSSLPPAVYFIYNYQQINALNLQVSGIDASGQYVLKTDAAGQFNFGLAVSDELTFNQQVGTGGPTFSVLNTTGINTTFPSVQLSARANLGWKIQGASANLFVNYTGGYRNWSGTTATPVIRVNGVPVGGGDSVSANTTIDIHLQYDFSSGWLDKAAVYLDVSNLLDRDPPFYNSTVGYDTFEGDPIGRVVSIGVRKKF
jgi:iron complex outermembrane receptor protein